MATLNLFIMGRIIFLCFCFIPVAFSSEEVVVVHAPESIKFLSSEPIHSSFIGDIFSAMLSYTFPSNIGWHSLAVVHPWDRPEAITVLEIKGFNNKVNMPIAGTKFLLENAGDIGTQRDLLSYRTEQRFLGERPVLLYMELGGELYDSKVVQPLLLKSVFADPQKRLTQALANPEIREIIKESTFNISVPSETQLLTELATMREFLKALKSYKPEIRDNIPDIYWLSVEGLVPIVKIYGVKSLQFQEAIRLIRQMISEVETTMRNVYNDNVVFSVVKVDDIPSSYGFKNRKLLAETTTMEPSPSKNEYNLASQWSPMFPVIFMMILFVVLGLFVSILGVSVGMWNMDPGKDSIIYRATQRLKKD